MKSENEIDTDAAALLPLLMLLPLILVLRMQ